jgi:hypothetical protein
MPFAVLVVCSVCSVACTAAGTSTTPTANGGVGGNGAGGGFFTSTPVHRSPVPSSSVGSPVQPAPAPTGFHIVSWKSASGDLALTATTGDAKFPAAIDIRVLASPDQSASINWTVICTKDFGAGSKSGKLTAKTPVTKQLELPMPSPDDCILTGFAQLSRSGEVTIEFLAR